MFFFIEPGINQEIGRNENRIPGKGYKLKMRKICESIFFNQTCRPANYVPLYLIPKSRDP